LTKWIAAEFTFDRGGKLVDCNSENASDSRECRQILNM
jgi:hypothetical protein